jgi:cytochrome c biogenesis protein CcmG/thiol:disulfide interchange protein DsbE
MKRLLVLAPLLVFVLLGAAFAIGLFRDPSRIPSALIDRPLPSFDLPPPQGLSTGFASAHLKGRVALVNVFASWCASCLVEHPTLMEIANAEGVPIAGLNWKDPDGAGWLSKHGNPYAFVGDDARGKVALDLGVTGAPETFIVDREGRIRYKHVGPITPRIWIEQLKPLVERLENDAQAGA